MPENATVSVQDELIAWMKKTGKKAFILAEACEIEGSTARRMPELPPSLLEVETPELLDVAIMDTAQFAMDTLAKAGRHSDLEVRFWIAKPVKLGTLPPFRTLTGVTAAVHIDLGTNKPHGPFCVCEDLKGFSGLSPLAAAVAKFITVPTVAT